MSRLLSFVKHQGQQSHVITEVMFNVYDVALKLFKYVLKGVIERIHLWKKYVKIYTHMEVKSMMCIILPFGS